MRKVVLRNRKDEAAGNDGLSSGTNGLQVRRKAQDFRRWVRRACSSNECQYVREWLFLLRGPKVRKGIASLSSEAAGLLQSFITSFAGSVSHKSLP